MEGATAAAPQASVAAVHRTPRRPKDACRTCRKGKNACTATLAGSAVVVYFLLLLCFIISIAVLGFTASVGKYFLLIANAWRNGLGGLSLSLTLFAMIALKARFQNVLYFISNVLYAVGWGFLVVASFDGGQVFAIYQDGNDRTVEAQVDGAVVLGLIAWSLWLLTGAVLNRRADIIAKEVEEEQKLFDSLAHVGAGVEQYPGAEKA